MRLARHLVRWLGRRAPGAQPFQPPGIRATYADLLKLRAQVSRPALPPGQAAERPGGERAFRRGQGLEPEEARLYQPGDDPRAIDWPVSARTGRIHVRLFREPRERPRILVTDLGPHMAFGTRGAFKSVAAARAVALLAWEGVESGDPVGAVLIGGGPRSLEHRLRLGEAGVRGILRGLERGTAAVAGDPPAPPPADGLAEGLARAARLAPGGSRVVVLSDFAGLGDKAAGRLERLGARCRLALVAVHDPLERELPPPGRYPLGAGGETLVLSTGGSRRRAAYRARFDEHRERLARLARRQGGSMVALATDAPLVATLRQGILSPSRGAAVG